MRKSELYEIKVREYERGLLDARNMFRIDSRDVQNWAEGAREQVISHRDWSYIEDTMKEMLKEIGVTIIKSGKE